MARAERELDRLADAEPSENTGTSQAQDPYVRVLDDFRFKEAPLYVQQVESSSDHRLFVRVNRDAFCLNTVATRKEAATAVYERADTRLRRAGVRDFEFILVPLGEPAPNERDALAVGKAGRLRLTPTGRDC